MYYPIIYSLLVFAYYWDVSISNQICHNSKAINIKCYNQKLETLDGTIPVRINEDIVYKVEQITNACDFTISDFRLALIPPSTSGNPPISEVLKYPSIKKGINGIMKYHLNFGSNTLRVYALKDGVIVAEPAECSMIVEDVPPLASISGGTEKYYVIGQENIVDASNSANLNDISQSHKDLSFQWACEEVPPQTTAFCQEDYMAKFEDKTKLIIPAEYCERENGFVLSLLVTVNSTNKQADTSQLVMFHSNPDSLKIECIKNCAPKTKLSLPSLPVILKAVCNGCMLHDGDFLRWTISDEDNVESVNYDLVKNRTGEDFYLEANGLLENSLYTVLLEVEGDIESKLGVTITLQTGTRPVLKECELNPTEGVAGQTKFKVSCVHSLHEILFELYSIKNGESTLLNVVTDLTNVEFVLSAGQITVVVKLTDAFGYTQEVNLEAQVSEILDLETKSDADVKKIMENLSKSVVKAAQDGQVNTALQQLAAIVSESSILPQNKMDLKLELDKQALEIMDKFEIKTAAQAQQSSEMLSKITESYKNNPDPDISARSAKLCTQASKVFENSLQTVKNPELYRDKFSNAIKSMSSCSQAGLNENLETVSSATIELNVTTTGTSLIDSIEFEEFYPDYLDDTNSSINVANFQMAADYMKQTCFSNAKILCATMIPEEDPLITKQGLMAIISARKYRTEVSSCTISSQKIILHPSKDLKKYTDVSVFDILICTTSKNPYWSIDNIPLISSVVYVKFSVAKMKSLSQKTKKKSSKNKLDILSHFTDPFVLVFLKTKNVKPKLNYTTSPLPESHIFELDESTFYDSISMYRIYVYNNRGYTLEFQDIPSDHYYDVLLTDMEKPTFSYFKDHYITISKNNSVIHNWQTDDYDKWVYLTVLPNKKLNYVADTTYSFSVSTLACYGWNETKKLWMFSCRAIEINKNITCYCHYGEVLTPYYSTNRVNLVEDIEIEFVLEIKSCWIILITTAIIFLTFLILLIIFSFETKPDILNKIFFVGDVPSFYKFAYIIIIKTGNKRQSGTTSNITIKLHGTKSDSLEHVLNYPDPELVMLENNQETWFVIATEKALGNIESISVWFDSIGNNCKWYCSKITVYDIQEETMWVFNIEKWFDVMKENHHNFVFTLAKTGLNENSKASEKMIQLIGNLVQKSNDRTNLWKLSTKHPLLIQKERILLIFSGLVTSGAINLLLYSVPKFDESDSIDGYALEFSAIIIWSSIISTSLSFIVHFPLMALLEKVKLQEIRRSITINNTYALFSWGSILTLSLLSMTILVSCGFWIPKNTSVLWLLSVLIGIAFNVLILQNLYTLILGYLLKLPTLAEAFQNTTRKIIRYIELQRTFVYKRFGSLSLRPYFQHLYSALDHLTLKEKQKKEISNQQIVEILEDLFMILLYVGFLYIVLLMDKESMAVYSHAEIEKLLSGKYIDQQMKITMLSDIHGYFKQILLPSFQSYLWYGNFLLVSPGITRDFSNKYLGIIRLRQQRTRCVKCALPDALQFFNLTCRLSLSEQSEFGDFIRNWQPVSPYVNDSKERMGHIWKYSQKNVTGTSTYFGQLGIYPGGGYVAPLGRTIVNSHINLYYLRQNNWIDLRSRALFLEFLTYNPNCNLFNTIQAVFEISSSGFISHKFEIQTRRLLMVDSDVLIVHKIVYFCFVGILLVLMGRLIYKMVTKRLQFIFDSFCVFDLVIGQLGIYPGGGYVAPLGRTIVNSHINLYYLRQNNWIDLRSRALFLEFLTYNPNCNLFNTIQAVFEISSSGFISHKFEIQTRRLLMVDSDVLIVHKIVYFCFVGILLVLMGRLIYKMVTKRLQFIFDSFCVFDLVIVCLSVASIYLYYSRMVQLNDYITELSNSKNNQFINYFHLFVVDNTFTALSATLVFIATFRLWKLLRFMVIIKITEKVLKDSFVPILVACTYHSISMIAFSTIATIFFCSESKEFINTYTSFTTLLLLSFNLLPEFNIHPLEQHAFGRLFYVTYVMFSLFFVTIYIAIITLYFSNAKDYYSDDKSIVQEYVKKKWIYYTTLLKVRLRQLRAGQDDDDTIIKPITCVRYDNCFTIPKSRINSMALITLCILRNQKRHQTMAKEDIKLISNLIREMFRGESEDKEIFFTTEDSGKIKFVDNKKIENISVICEKLAHTSQLEEKTHKSLHKAPIEQRIEKLNTIIEGVNILTRVLNNINIQYQ